MYRYVISYEPYNFKGRLEDFPLTLAYGKSGCCLRASGEDHSANAGTMHTLKVAGAARSASVVTTFRWREWNHCPALLQ